MNSIVRSNVAAKVDIVVHVSKGLVTNVHRSVTEVSDELSLGHLVLDVGTGEVHTQQDERVADHMEAVWGGQCSQ